MQDTGKFSRYMDISLTKDILLFGAMGTTGEVSFLSSMSGKYIHHAKCSIVLYQTTFQKVVRYNTIVHLQILHDDYKDSRMGEVLWQLRAFILIMWLAQYTKQLLWYV